jgi:hypothetical protein
MAGFRFRNFVAETLTQKISLFFLFCREEKKWFQLFRARGPIRQKNVELFSWDCQKVQFVAIYRTGPSWHLCNACVTF